MPKERKAVTQRADAPGPWEAAAPASRARGGARLIASEELFAGTHEIAIEHNGRRYQLRITRTGKLILTA